MDPEWEYEEKKRKASMMFGIPLALCIIAAVVAIGVSVYVGSMNYLFIGIICVCVIGAIILGFLLFSARAKYDRLMEMRR